MAGADQMRQYTERYDALKAELQSLGFLFAEDELVLYQESLVSHRTSN